MVAQVRVRLIRGTTVPVDHPHLWIRVLALVLVLVPELVAMAQTRVADHDVAHVHAQLDGEVELDDVAELRPLARALCARSSGDVRSPLRPPVG